MCGTNLAATQPHIATYTTPHPLVTAPTLLLLSPLLPHCSRTIVILTLLLSHTAALNLVEPEPVVACLQVHDPNEAPQNYQDKHTHIKDTNRRSLAAMMSALDDQLTAIVDKFKELCMWDDTVLVFSTGESHRLAFNSKE